MRIVNKIFKAIKAIVYLPINLYNLSKRSDELFRIEKKLDLFSKKLDYINFDAISKPLEEFIQYQTKKSNLESNQEKSIDLALSSIISKLDQKFENQFLQIESLLSIYNSLPNLKFFPATRGWVGSPDFLAKIVEVILKEKPQFVFEASSGVSSVIIGLALKMNNHGKAIALDHDRFYAKTTNENIEVNEIKDISCVEYCPLRDYTIQEQIWKWYETCNLKFTDKIDLLIIDGPPRTTQFLARYPAIPLLHEYFSDRVLILLDDANRHDEVIIVKMWMDFLEKINFKVEVNQFRNFEKGMTILIVQRLI
ncbi:class I SAM-dependent methyltransferase [Aquiflexum gelatinilyticum]|uniref:class I SAM-dependent methyltransferase n=1 Tax=Aquiflexum gelatinilyticum TaxID=2961943 RepID=UPI002169115C|nr:class I SAM-dependent methyltransferase [Aquiflexum gelatinilyticum]MCS4432860.1 class I SAM-dependent methyltransferase [Aquiflexum gelatinilyticum]